MCFLFDGAVWWLCTTPNDERRLRNWGCGLLGKLPGINQDPAAVFAAAVGVWGTRVGTSFADVSCDHLRYLVIPITCHMRNPQLLPILAGARSWLSDLTRRRDRGWGVFTGFRGSAAILPWDAPRSLGTDRLAGRKLDNCWNMTGL